MAKLNEAAVVASSPFSSGLKISSKQIAEVVDKKHQHVMRDIRKLIDEGAFNGSKPGLVAYKDVKGEPRPMYELDFEATMTLITGYDSKRRNWVIRRWMDLETGAATPLGVVGDMISVNKHYFDSVLKNTKLLEENNDLLKKLLEEAENRVPKRRNFSKEEDEQVLSLRAQGLSPREIGLKIGRKPESIRSCLRRLEGR